MLACIDVCCGGVPAKHGTSFIQQRLILNEKPAVLTIHSPRSLLEFERARSPKRCFTRFAKALRILGMKDTRANIAILYFLKRQARIVERHLIRIEGTTLGTE